MKRISLFVFLLCTFLFISLINSNAYALEPSEQIEQLPEIKADADTILHAGYPDTNFGDARTLVATDFTGIFSFIRFNLSSIPSEIINAHRSGWRNYIESAKLGLFVYTKPSSSSDEGLVGTQYIPGGWNEYTLTYHSLEQIVGNIAGFSGDTFNFSQIEVNRFTEINVTSLVNNYLRTYNTGEVTFHINVVWKGNFNFSSRHNINLEPRLSLFYKKFATSLSFHIPKQSLTSTESLDSWGTTEPILNGTIVKLIYYPPNGGTPIERRSTVNSAGMFEDEYTPNVAGAWKVIAKFDGNNIYASSNSTELAFDMKEPPPILYYLPYIVLGLVIVGVPLGFYLFRRMRRPRNVVLDKKTSPP